LYSFKKNGNDPRISEISLSEVEKNFRRNKKNHFYFLSKFYHYF